MINKIELVKVEAVRVRYKGKYGNKRNRIFPSRRIAESKIAWWMIFDKYNQFTRSYSEYGFTGDKPKYRPPYDCDCDMRDGGTMESDCPLHSRDDGYFKVLHDRLLRRFGTQAGQVQ